MPKKVFYSFQYQPDNWRVHQVINARAISGGAAFIPQEWEKVRRQTDAAIEQWIHTQMNYSKAVIVLVGETTAESRWVRYEIEKAWNDRRPLIGVRINGLKDSNGNTQRRGINPFDTVTDQHGFSLTQHGVKLMDPGTSSLTPFSDIEQNLENWVAWYARTRF